MSKTTQVGVAWLKDTPQGQLISVKITNPFGEDHVFTLWPMQEKRSENAPDYSVTKQSDQAKREYQAGAAAAPRQAARPVAAAPRTYARPAATTGPADFPTDDGREPLRDAREDPRGDDNVPF